MLLWRAQEAAGGSAVALGTLGPTSDLARVVDGLRKSLARLGDVDGPRPAACTTYVTLFQSEAIDPVSGNYSVLVDAVRFAAVGAGGIKCFYRTSGRIAEERTDTVVAFHIKAGDRTCGIDPCWKGSFRFVDGE